ncbi:MAG: formylglycine-generating enzyme family protein, partial [Deltaproteobacteria bacterium]|nr:formylglycine-generating enzyme family protein [Deltaproteobacteria bacterium]
ADDARDDRKPYAQVWVSTFWIDTHEVTNEAFDACIKAGACKKHERYKGFMGPDQPAVGLTWYNAEAYCSWTGKRLPTEAEWEKAARGPDGDIYPWGNDAPTCGLAHFRGCTPPTTLAVGSFAPGHYGLYDMAGNGYEWVQDWYSPCYDGCEGGCGAACTERDPKGPCGGKGEKCGGFLKLKVLRGGSWFWPASQIPVSWRRPYKPESGEHRLSVRCAATPPKAGG